MSEQIFLDERSLRGWPLRCTGLALAWTQLSRSLLVCEIVGCGEESECRLLAGVVGQPRHGQSSTPSRRPRANRNDMQMDFLASDMPCPVQPCNDNF